MKKITVIGSGKFGTALAFAFSHSADSMVTIYSNKDRVASAINSQGFHPDFPDVGLGVIASNDFSASVVDADYILIVVPTYAIVEILQKIKQVSRTEHGVVVICAKGIIGDRPWFYSDLAAQTLPQEEIAVLSGPSFATEILAGMDTEINIASESKNTAQELADLLKGSNIVASPMEDLHGLQLLGAYKNIIAMRMGIEEGMLLELRKNPEHYRNKISSIFVGMLGEVLAIMQKLGCNQETVFDFGGIGDIVLTSYCKVSRNRSFGEAFGEELIRYVVRKQKFTQQEVELMVKKRDTFGMLVNVLTQDEIQNVFDKTKTRLKGCLTEGYLSINAFVKLCKHINVEVPLLTQMSKISL